MNRAYTTAVLLASCLSLPLLAASPSNAFVPGCPCGVVQAYHGDTKDWVTKETTEAATRIIEALRAQTQQTSTHIDRQVEAGKRIADGQEQSASMRMREYFRARAESGEFDPNPDYCLLVDMADSQLHSPSPSRQVAAIDATLDQWSSGKATPVAEGGLRLAAWLHAEGREIDEATGIPGVTTDWELVNEHPTLPIELHGASNAIVRLVANTVDPAPPPALTEEELKTPSGLSESIVRKAVETRKNAARSALSLSLQLSVPRHDAAVFRTLASRANYSTDIPDVISDLQAFDIRTMAYFAPNADTLEERHGKPVRALMQDLIDIQSIQARIGYLRLLQETRNAAMLAAQLGVLTDGQRSTLTHR
ncbi:MAG: hypothetical protein OXB95_10860 [Rhodobacteraceae bacterium]|nr:hypothetical protein [Paracoccaceae bacterium]